MGRGDAEVLDVRGLGVVLVGDVGDEEGVEDEDRELADGDAEAEAVGEAGGPEGFGEDEGDEGDERRDAQGPEGAAVVVAGGEAVEGPREDGFTRQGCHGGMIAKLDVGRGFCDFRSQRRDLESSAIPFSFDKVLVMEGLISQQENEQIFDESTDFGGVFC